MNSDPEAAIVSACLSAGGIEIARQHIAPEHFAQPHYRRTYQAMIDLHAEGQTIDFVVLTNRLGLDCGFISNIAALVGDSGIPSNIPNYADMVKDRYVTRRIKEIANGKLSPQERMEHIAKINVEVDVGSGGEHFMASAYNELQKEIKNPQAAHPYESGIDELDRKIGGFHPGTVTAIQALYKTGKTKFLMQIMINALKRDHGVGFLSLEMSKARVMKWMLSHYCRVDSYFFRDPQNARWDDERLTLMAQIANVGRSFTALPFFVNDIRRPTIDQVGMIVENWVRQGVKLVGIDYFERMDTGAEWKDEGIVTSRLADIASKHNIALIYVDQLNKAAESSSDISWANSRGSTARNADADIILQMINKSRSGRRREADKMAQLKISVLGREVPSGISVQVMADLSIGDFKGMESNG